MGVAVRVGVVVRVGVAVRGGGVVRGGAGEGGGAGAVWVPARVAVRVTLPTTHWDVRPFSSARRLT